MKWYRYWVQESPPPASAISGPRYGEGASHAEGNKRAAEFHVEQDAGTPFHVEQGNHDPDRREAVAAGPVPEAPPPTTVVVANQKGGVGKTTTALSVAAALAQRGLRVLLVDLDPQGNASSGLGCRAGDGQATAYEVLVGNVDAAAAITPTRVDGLSLLPSSLDLAGAEIELVSAFSREQTLRRVLGAVTDDYDLIFVDCPPSLGLLTVNALTAGDVVLVPIQCEYYALEGLGSLTQNVDLIRRHLNPALDTVGYVLTMHDGRTRLSEQVVAEVRAHFGDAVFDAKVPRSVRLAEAPSYGEPITVFDPGSRGAVAYHRVAIELLERLQRRAAGNGTAGATVRAKTS